MILLVELAHKINRKLFEYSAGQDGRLAVREKRHWTQAYFP